MNTLQELLRQKRKEKGLTNKQVGEIVDAHHSLISAYETGRRRPSMKFLKRLAKLYELSYLDLLIMRDDKTVDVFHAKNKLFRVEKQNEQYIEALNSIHMLSTKDGTMKEISKITTDILFERTN